MNKDPNGWRLVGKIALVVLIPTFAGAVWVGALGQTVENQGSDIEVLEMKMDVQASNQSAILANQENIKAQLAEIRSASRVRQW